MATSIIKNNGGLVPDSRITLNFANANIMELVSGAVAVYQLNDSYFIAFASIGIRYTASRNTDMAAWRIILDGENLTPLRPHFIASWVDGTNNCYQSYCDSATSFFKNPIALSANQIARWTGTILYRK